MGNSDPVDVIFVQWQRERPDLDVSPMGVGAWRLAKHLERAIQETFSEFGLNVGEFDVLVTCGALVILISFHPPHCLTR